MARRVSCMCCRSVDGLRAPIYVKALEGMYIMVLCDTCFLSISKEA